MSHPTIKKHWHNTIFPPSLLIIFCCTISSFLTVRLRMSFSSSPLLTLSINISFLFYSIKYTFINLYIFYNKLMTLKSKKPFIRKNQEFPPQNFLLRLFTVQNMGLRFNRCLFFFRLFVNIYIIILFICWWSLTSYKKFIKNNCLNN